MGKKQLIAITGVLLALTLFVFVADFISKKRKAPSDGKIAVVTWNDLYELDIKTNIVPDNLKKLDGKTIRIAGYVVPLTDDYFVLNEFLLVPNAQACIHAPPPPPNLIIHVKLDTPLPIEKVYNPAWIEGTFEIKTTTSQYGNASYKIEDASIEEYKY